MNAEEQRLRLVITTSADRLSRVEAATRAVGVLPMPGMFRRLLVRIAESLQEILTDLHT